MLPNVLSHCLNTKSLVLLDRRRPQEADALLTRALAVALEHDRHQAALRAYANLSVLHGGTLDQYERPRPSSATRWPWPSAWANAR